MALQHDVARGREIVARWCVLAEQRLEHLTELYESGRWRRYHSELSFIENVQEAKAALETWRQLATIDASHDNTALDMSWLGRLRSAMPLADPAPSGLQSDHEPEQLAASSVSIVPEFSDLTEAGPTTRGDDAFDLSSGQTAEVAAIAERYPLLRNAL